MSTLFPSCAETARRISEAQDHPLPPIAHCGMTLHLLLCRFCRRYRRQLILLRETCQRLNHELDQPSAVALSPQARQRILDILDRSR